MKFSTFHLQTFYLLLCFQNLCQKCKRHYCNDCFAKETKFAPGENTRHCLTCRALQSPVAYKDHLKRLKIKDLQDYLRARQISMDQCKEKRDLIELILRHAEERSATVNPTSNSQNQARQQTRANPPQVNLQRPTQPRSSNFYPPSNSQPVQVCAFILNHECFETTMCGSRKCPSSPPSHRGFFWFPSPPLQNFQFQLHTFL